MVTMRYEGMLLFSLFSESAFSSTKIGRRQNLEMSCVLQNGRACLDGVPWILCHLESSSGSG